MTVKLTDFNIKLFDELDSTNDYAKMEFNNLEKPFIISTGFQKKVEVSIQIFGIVKKIKIY